MSIDLIFSSSSPFVLMLSRFFFIYLFFFSSMWKEKGVGRIEGKFGCDELCVVYDHEGGETKRSCWSWKEGGEGRIIISFDKHAMILSNGGESGQTYLCDPIVNMSRNAAANNETDDGRGSFAFYPFRQDGNKWIYYYRNLATADI